MQVLLYTERLVLRNLDASDREHFISINQSDALNQFIRPVASLLEIEDKFSQRLEPWSFESSQWFSLVIERIDKSISAPELVGIIGFRADDVSLKRAEVGYILVNDQQGYGFATEALNAVIDWGIIQFSMHKFIAHCASVNLSSINVLQKVGFQLEGIIRQNTRHGDKWFDDHYFGLLCEERSDLLA